MKRLKNFLKVTQLVKGEVGIWTHAHLAPKAILTSFTEGLVVLKIDINGVFDLRAKQRVLRLTLDLVPLLTGWGMLGKVLKLCYSAFAATANSGSLSWKIIYLEVVVQMVARKGL